MKKIPTRLLTRLMVKYLFSDGVTTKQKRKSNRHKRNRNQSVLVRVRSFRLTMEEDLHLHALAIRFDTNANTIMRHALNDYWHKHGNKPMDTDNEQLRKEVQTTVRKFLDKI